MSVAVSENDARKDEGEVPLRRASSSGRGAGPSGARARTCVGCGERVDVSAGGSALVRLILGPGGEVAVDSGSGGFGRGAHVHPRPDCLAKAVQRGLAKAAKGRVSSIRVSAEGDGVEPLRVDTLAAAIRASMDRRIQGLLATAIRSHQASLGAEAATGACERGEAALVVVACDAAASADLAQVRRAVAEGRAVSWGTKQSLGALAGRGEAGIGVLAITSSRIAGALRDAVHVADECVGRAKPAAPAQREGARAAGGGGGDRGRKPEGQEQEPRETRREKRQEKPREPRAGAQKAGASGRDRREGPRHGQPERSGGKAGGVADRAHGGGGSRREARAGRPADEGSSVAAGAAAKRGVDG